MRRHLALVVLGLVAALAPARIADAQASDLRAIHDIAVHAMVTVANPAAGLEGSGWLFEQTAPARPVVITNRHVAVRARARVHVSYYLGTDTPPAQALARVLWVSTTIDLAIVQLDSDPPATARALAIEPGDVVRGERVVVAGSPHGIAFQTSEGVVTGALPEVDLSAACGVARNCLVVDAASFSGSSGGPALNAQGRVVGMLWGGPAAEVRTSRGSVPAWVGDAAFAYLIHARTIEQELRAFGEARHAGAARADE